MLPSGSVEENLTVTSSPVVVGLGETLKIVTVGGRSLTVSVVVADAGPAALVAVTLMVKVDNVLDPVLV
jgi:hypothetical protein